MPWGSDCVSQPLTYAQNFKPLWKCLRLEDLAQDCLRVNFWCRDFCGFCWKPWGFFFVDCYFCPHWIIPVTSLEKVPISVGNIWTIPLVRPSASVAPFQLGPPCCRFHHNKSIQNQNMLAGQISMRTSSLYKILYEILFSFSFSRCFAQHNSAQTQNDMW